MKYIAAFFIASISLISCTTQPPLLTVNESALGQFAFGLPEYPTASLQPAQKHVLWATQYYVHYAEATNANGHALLDMNGNSFGVMLTAKDWCMGGVEGTIQAKDSTGTLRTYNYAGRGKEIQVDCAPFFNKGTLINAAAIGRTRYVYATGPFGDGVKGLILVPFRTIATDTNMFPTGSIVYIPSARGIELELPDGSRAKHDGYFVAGDIGGAIKGNHIDVFTGVYRKNPFPSIVQSRSSATFEAFSVSDARVREILLALHQARKN
jgi:3D (Asp-Asp-Asp) domain-containing protein